MSCTVFALPYALAWVIGSVVVGAAGAIQSRDELRDENLDISTYVSEQTLENYCNDIHVINETNFIEKSFETAFMDKELLMKTIEEHGLKGIQEDEFGRISGTVDNYTLTFEKMEADKPYFLRISCTDKDKPEEKIDDLSSEYALNVQEEAYLNIVDKLKANNMEIEDEEVLDDNTIVLTVNLE